MPAADQALVDAFADALWLEDGLSKNTLAAYRSDLTQFADWLAARGTALSTAQEADVQGYLADRFAHSKATSANRRLDRKSTRLNSSHTDISRMPSSA